MMRYQQYTCPCVYCGGLTNKAYARKNDGKCKQCTTGESKQGLKCPDCGQNTLTPFQRKNSYHCDACTRQTEIGY